MSIKKEEKKFKKDYLNNKSWNILYDIFELKRMGIVKNNYIKYN